MDTTTRHTQMDQFADEEHSAAVRQILEVIPPLVLSLAVHLQLVQDVAQTIVRYDATCPCRNRRVEYRGAHSTVASSSSALRRRV